jgi:hypothetical protein
MRLLKWFFKFAEAKSPFGLLVTIVTVGSRLHFVQEHDDTLRMPLRRKLYR